MLRSATKPEISNSDGANRPQTAFQALQAGSPPNFWYTSYMRVLNDHRRVVIRQTKRIQTSGEAGKGEIRPMTSAFPKRLRECVSSEAIRPLAAEEQLKGKVLSQKECDVPISAAAALIQFGHNQRPQLQPSKDPLTDFIIGSTLGQGSFASVKKAVNKQTNSPVAIKTYEKYKLIDANRKKGVAREIKILNQLNHVNIVKLLKVIEGPRHLHLVMEFVDGQSLYSYLKQKEPRRLTEGDAKEIFKQLVEGLCYLHEKGVTHRDLKLQNVLLDQSRTVKIIDFGFSTQVASERKVKMYCGTPNYMAPEIVERREYLGAPADIWAAGVLLFAMLCGEFPFKGLSDRELYKRIQAGTFLVPSHVSATGKEMIAAMLSIDPSQRPSAKSLLTFPWLTGLKSAFQVQRPATTPILFRQRNSALSSPLAAYDQDIIGRLVCPKQRNLGYTDAMLIRELQDEKSHVFNLYQRLMEVKTGK